MKSKIGRYKVLEKVVPGSVFLAEDDTGATKILKQYEWDSGLVLSGGDARILMNLQHVNLLAPTDIIVEGKFRYAVYEYSNLDNLQEYLKKKGKFTEKELSSISKQIINGYQFIKDKGLIPGNIKPTSILIDENGKLTNKLTDFLLQLSNKKDLSNNIFIAPEIV